MIHSEIRAPDCVGRGRAQSLGSVYFTYIAALKSHFATARQRFITHINITSASTARAGARGRPPAALSLHVLPLTVP